jgi:hypothetical protein
MARNESLSTAARWLRAVVRNDADARRALGDMFDEDELYPLVGSAFSLAVARRFSPNCDVRAITRQALGVRQRYADRSPQLLQMEMVVRRELGESVPVDDLRPDRVLLIKMWIFEQLVYDLGLFDDELDELIAEAERSGRRDS